MHHTLERKLIDNQLVWTLNADGLTYRFGWIAKPDEERVARCLRHFYSSSPAVRRCERDANWIRKPATAVLARGRLAFHLYPY